MLELGVLFGALFILGFIFLLAKLAISLFLIPLKIGIGALKLVVFMIVGIPLLILGCILLGVLLPAALVLLPVLAVGGAVIGLVLIPFVLLFRAFS